MDEKIQIMSDTLLKVKDLSIAFAKQPTPVVDRLSFALSRGQCLGLVGESGSGKSMTALAIMQLLPAAARVSYASKVLFQGEDLLTCSERQMRKIRGAGIGLIFQDAMAAFNPVFTIGNQLLEILQLHKRLNKRQAYLTAINLLERVGIHEPVRMLQSYAHQLSGGMRQRAMIAMALSCDPKLLIADEPTTALDVTIQAQILELLLELKKQQKMTLLFISHDLAVVSKLADEIVVLKSGQIVEQAKTKVFFSAPQSNYSKTLLAAIPALTARKTAQQSALLLRVDNLKVHFPIRKGILKRVKSYVKAVDGIDLSIPKGQTLALVGESGSGKTTTGKAILRLLSPSAGSIMLEGLNLTKLSRQALKQARRKMQIIFQDPYSALNPRMLVFDSLAEGLFTQAKAHSRKQAEKLIDAALTQVHLPIAGKWRYPHEFSGGQRQRLCIARALVLEPELLILDEPTSALDVSIQMQILKLLEELQQRLNLTYLLITHNLGVVAYLAEFIAVMFRGKIIEQGETSAILSNPTQPYTKKLFNAIPTLHEKDKP